MKVSLDQQQENLIGIYGTTERLLAVADLVGTGRWDQNSWVTSYGRNDEDTVLTSLRKDEELCGTTCCVAGWAVALSPPNDPTSPNIPPATYGWWERSIWREMGAEALGLSECLADKLFDCSLPNCFDDEDIAELLREIATIPEGERTLDALDNKWFTTEKCKNGDWER